MKLRDYQVRAETMLMDWFDKNQTGNPVLNMPGGSGKSVVIGSIVKNALQSWPETRVLMLVHSRELISQNADKLRKLWANAPLGIYSASLNRRNLGEPITYAGIASVAKRGKDIGHVDLCLVDEAHAISNIESGIYRKLLSDLISINPNMRIIGFSASPYRLGHGLLTEGSSALFSEIIEPVSIEELVYKGHLMPLRSKQTRHKLETKGLHKRQGDFISSEMEEKFNTEDNNTKVVNEIIERSFACKHWLIFCAGISHSENISKLLNENGINSASLTSSNKKEREKLLIDFESGKIRALCNVGILTTGYDFPNLDCIVFLRATMSPGLYLQMAVRGMRPKEHTDHCLVLDFAGVVETHGPITAVQPPRKGSTGDGEAPVKVCDECGELVHISAQVCPACGHPFPAPKENKLLLRNDDIMGLEGTDLDVTEWQWRKHISQASGKEMLSCTFYGGLSDKPVTEYHCITHDGYAGQKARIGLATIARCAGASIDYSVSDIEDIASAMNEGKPPSVVEYKKDGKFYRVLNRKWQDQ